MKKYIRFFSILLCTFLLSAGIAPVSFIPFLSTADVYAAPANDILKLSVQNDSSTLNKYIMLEFSYAGANTYVFADGDYLEYDVKLDGSPWRVGSIDIECRQGDSYYYFNDVYGFHDQNGINGGYEGDLAGKASNTWYHRKIKIPGSRVGKTITKWFFHNRNNMNGTAYSVYYDNIQITNGSGMVKLSVYSDGTPEAAVNMGTAGIVAYKLQSPVYSFEAGIPSGDTLKFTVTNANSTGDNKFVYWKFSNVGSGAYTFAAGDYIEYDVILKHPFDWGAGGIEIICTDGSAFRTSSWIDQRSIEGHPAGDITKYADGEWYHRILEVPASMYGKVISRWDFVGENDDYGRVYTAYYDNVKVTDGSGGIRLTAYDGGNPSLNEADFNYNASVVLSTSKYMSNSGTQSGDVLKYFVQTTPEDWNGFPIDWNSYSNKFCYWKISETGYTITEGDYLEYDVKMSPSNAYHAGVGVDMGFTDGTFTREASDWEDQNGISGHPAGDIGRYAVNQWYHRKIKFPESLIGKTVSKWMVAAEHDGEQIFITSYFDNIKITNNTSTQASAYSDGNPSCNESDLASGTNFAVLAPESVSGYPSPSPVVVSTTLPVDDVPVISFNVTDFGAVGDGTTDDTYAFQEALYAADAAGGGVVFAPSGSYAIRGHLYIPMNVILRGEWRNPDEGGLGQGTILKAFENRSNENGMAFIGMNAGSGVTNMSIWYPEQSYSTVYPYPWTVKTLYGDNFTLRNVTMINSYKGIQCAPTWNEMEYFNNVYGTVLRKGIEICYNTDIFRFDNIKFKPDYWSNSGLDGAPSEGGIQMLKDYMVANAEGIIVARADWGYMYNITLRSFKIGIKYIHKFSAIDDPAAGNGSMVKVDIDEGNIGLLVEELNTQGLAVSDSSIKASAGMDPAAFMTASTFNSYVSFNKCTMGGAPKTAASLQGSGVVSFQNCTFDDWGYQGGTYAIDAQQGSVTVEGCNFLKDGWSINLPSTVISASILGNTFNGTPLIANNSGKGTDYVVIEHTDFNYAQMSTSGHVYRSSLPKPANNNLYVVTQSPYNADNTGTNDAAAVIQNALNAAGNTGGGTVYVPAGKYKMDGTLSVPAGVELRGVNDTPHHTMSGGSVFFVYSGKGNASGTPFITLAQNAGVRGMTFYYPEQDHLNVQQYPWTIRGNGSGVYVMYTVFANSYQGIDFGYTNNCDNHYINYAGGCFLKTGIYAGKSATEGWVENVHINPHYWLRAAYIGNPNGTSSEWINTLYPHILTDTEGLVLGYCNNEHILSYFIFGARTGIRVSSQTEGKCNAKFYLAGMDNQTKGIHIEDVGGNGVDFIGSQFIIHDKTSGYGGYAFTDKGYLTVDSSCTGTVRMFNSTDGASIYSRPIIGIQVNGGTVIIEQFGMGKSSDRFIKLNGGSTQIDNVYTKEYRTDETPTHYEVEVGAGIDYARFLGGVYTGGFHMINNAGDKTGCFGNVTR